MLDFKHARPRFGNRRRQPGNATGPVTHVRRESPQPTISGQTMVDHTVQNGRVDVATTEQQHHLAAGKFLTQRPHYRRQGCRAGPLADRLFQFQQSQDGKRQGLFIDSHHPVDPWCGQRKSPLANLAHCQTVCQGRPDRGLNRPAGRKRCRETGSRSRFHRNDANSGTPGLGCHGHAGQQPRPARRHHDGVGFGHIIQHLECGRPLPGNHLGVIKAMNEPQAIGRRQFNGPLPGIFKGLTLQQHPRPQPPAGGHLYQRSKPGHDNGNWNTQQFAVIGKPEGVVAGGGCDHTAAPLVLVEQ